MRMTMMLIVLIILITMGYLLAASNLPNAREKAYCLSTLEVVLLLQGF